MNDYEARQEARRDRLQGRADKARTKSESHFKRSDDAVAGIPMGQPILIGHHSEKRHRAALARSHSNMRHGIDESKKADRLESRAAAVGTGGISADDPEAVRKLKEQLAATEQAQDKMKAANKALKKGDDDALRALGFTDKAIAGLKEPDFGGRAGFPAYALSNNGANIRRLKKRIEELEKAAARIPRDDIEGEGWTITENAELNRVQIIFDAKPGPDIRQALKSNGFRWAPSQSAWQRQLNNAGLYAAGQVKRFLDQAAD